SRAGVCFHEQGVAQRPGDEVVKLWQPHHNFFFRRYAPARSFDFFSKVPPSTDLPHQPFLDPAGMGRPAGRPLRLRAALTWSLSWLVQIHRPQYSFRGPPFLDSAVPDSAFRIPHSALRIRFSLANGRLRAEGSGHRLPRPVSEPG